MDEYCPPDSFGEFVHHIDHEHRKEIETEAREFFRE
jgi:hypothetical protein